MSSADYLQQIRDLAQKGLDELSSITNPQETTLIKSGDNIQSILDSAPSGAQFKISTEFRGDWDNFVIRKPVGLFGNVQNINKRVSPLSDVLPILIGAISVQAPGVMLNALNLVGKRKDSAIVSTGDGTSFIRVIMKGSDTGQRRAILANSPNVMVRYGYIYGITHDQDAQAILGFKGTKNLTVSDTYCEASGENIMFGGDDCKDEALIPQDALIDNCDLAKNTSWRGATGITVKNLFEIKNGKRITVQNTRMKYNWVGGQVGYAIQVTVRNQNGGDPFACIEDALFDNVTVEDTAAGINILGSDSNNKSGTLKRLMFRKVKFLNVDPKAWGSSGIAYQIQMGRGSENVSFDGMDFGGSNLSGIFQFTDPTFQHTKLSVKNSVFEEGAYGIHSAEASGKDVLDKYAPGYVWENNTVRKGTSGRKIVYPQGTTLV